MIKIDWTGSVAVEGNQRRLRNVMKKALAGEKLTIGFLGGSVTQGCLSSVPEKSYAYQVFQWWKHNFPKAELIYQNAGVGGTTSLFGVARVEADLLCYEPDFVIVEFAVNDENTELYRETYEGLIRRILKKKQEIAVLILNNVCYDTGASAEEQHQEVAEYYQIPCISMRNSLYRRIQDGAVLVSDITPDNLHPNDTGHALLAQAINDYLQKVYNGLSESKDSSAEVPHICEKEPLTANCYEAAVRIQNDAGQYCLNGFREDRPDGNQSECTDCHSTDLFQKGFVADKLGDSVVFEVYGSEIAVQYRRSVEGPAPKAVVLLDGEQVPGLLLDGQFDENWGDCLRIDQVLVHGECRMHTVEVRLTEVSPDNRVPFYLVSMIVSVNPNREIILLKPEYKERLWGGTRLATDFHYEIPGENTGECWLVSAHSNGDCVVENGFFAQRKLSNLWEEEPELFGYPGCDRFPLLVKIIDAKENLSVQVHPDDEYACAHEGGSFGKTECWYVLDCPEDASLIIGHKASDEDEMNRLIDSGQWDSFLNRLQIQKGDLIQILPGTIHSLTAGLMILEVQQSSDITYRLYDYDRLENGKKRELHLERAKHVITVPQPDPEQLRVRGECRVNEWNLLMQCEFYRIWKLKIDGSMELERQSDFLIISVISGSGFVAGIAVNKGGALIVPSGYGICTLEGTMEIIVTAV